MRGGGASAGLPVPEVCGHVCAHACSGYGAVPDTPVAAHQSGFCRAAEGRALDSDAYAGADHGPGQGEGGGRGQARPEGEQACADAALGGAGAHGARVTARIQADAAAGAAALLCAVPAGGCRVQGGRHRISGATGLPGLYGRNGSADPLFLQIKEEPASAYAKYIEYHGPHHQGQRVAEGQRAMQFQSDPFLGWTTIGHRQYLVRQLNDHKASIEVEDLKGPGLLEYAEICGELLARGHARSGDPCLIAGYLGNGKRFAEAILKFAEAYADQTERDWEALRRSKHVTSR